MTDLKGKLWRGVTDLDKRVIIAKRAGDGGMNMDDSQNQHQGPSGSGQLSPEPAEEKAGDDRSFALAGLFDDVDEGKDDASTREGIPRDEAENAVAQYKAMKVRPNVHDMVAFSRRQTAVLPHIRLWCHGVP